MKATIGLEIHAHLNTKSKLFCSCTTAINKAVPNTEVCPICLGYPGSKPKLNKKAVEYGITIALALESQIEPEIRFSRKNYFYPDMSKNYQITQYEIWSATEERARSRIVASLYAGTTTAMVFL